MAEMNYAERGPGIRRNVGREIDGKNAVIDSIRTPGEVEALQERDDFILIEVRAGMDAAGKEHRSCKNRRYC